MVREEPADGAVDVADGKLGLDRLAPLERGRGGLEQLPVERVRERGVLRARAAQRRAGRDVRHPQDVGEIDAAGLPVLDRLVGLEQVDAADQVLEAPHARAAP